MSETGTISVHFERKVSDGDYGNESASCSVTADFDGEAVIDGYAHELGRILRELCRDNVQAQLDRSPEQNVRRAAETREAREQRFARERAKRDYVTAVYAERSSQAQLDSARQHLVRAEQQADENFGDAAAVRAVAARRADVARYEAEVAAQQRRVAAAVAGVERVGLCEADLASAAEQEQDTPF